MGHSSEVTNPINEHLPLDITILLRVGLFAAVTFAISFGLMEIVFEKRFFTSMIYGELIITKSFIYTLVFAGSLIIMSILNQRISQGYFDFGQWKDSFSMLNLLAWISYMAVASVIINFTKEVNLKLDLETSGAC